VFGSRGWVEGVVKEVWEQLGWIKKMMETSRGEYCRQQTHAGTQKKDPGYRY
jgi:hypothetical protein